MSSSACRQRGIGLGLCGDDVDIVEIMEHRDFENVVWKRHLKT